MSKQFSIWQNVGGDYMTLKCTHQLVPVEGDDIFMCKECGEPFDSYTKILQQKNNLLEAIRKLDRATDQHLSKDGKGKGMMSAIYVRRICQQALHDVGET